MEKLKKLMERRDISEQDILNLINEFSDKYVAKVDYQKNLLETLDDQGIRNLDGEISNRNFPNDVLIKGEIEIYTKLFIPASAETSDSVIKRMKKEGYRPATFIELASVYNDLSDYQHQFSIYAFGSPFTTRLNNRVYPYINREGAKISRCSYPERKHDRVMGVRIE